MRSWLLIAAMLVAVRASSPAHATTRNQFDVAAADAEATLLVDPSAALIKAEALEALAHSVTASNSEVLLIRAERIHADALIRLNRLGQARPLLDTALKSIGVANRHTKVYGDLLVTKGGLDSMNGDAYLALQEYHAAHQVFRLIGDNKSRARTLIYIAVLYSEAFDHEKAIDYYQQASEAYQDSGQLSLAIFSNMGQIYKDMKRYHEARVATLKSLSIARSMNSTPLTAHVLRKLARIDLFAGHLAEADSDIAQASRLADPGDEDERAALFGVAAQAALQHGRIPEAARLIGQSFEGVDLATTTLPMRERHETAYDIYVRSGDARLALAHLAAMKRLDDQAARLATSTGAALMGARFDFANQRLKIAELQREEARRTLAYEIERGRLQRWIFLGTGAAGLVIIALLTSGLLALRRSRDRVRAANTDLAASNVALGKALKAKTEFLATTSHEIRTPLNGILGMTQVMLADRRLDPATRDRIGVVHGAGETLRALVDDILDVAKMEKGAVTINVGPLDLRAMLATQTRLWEEQARAKGLAFTIDLADCPGRIEGDSGRLRQIVFNLLSNAIKFTAAGGVTLRAETITGDTPRYRVTVSDTGVGIAPDKHALVFDPFQQADTSTTREYGGTGLGLAVCRTLARAMGGDVTLASAPGHGAAFTLDLPLVVPAEEPVVAKPRETLLIIERNPLVRSTLKAVVARHAPTVATTGSVFDALGALAAGGVARVLADEATIGEDLAALAQATRRAGAALALLSAGGPRERAAALDAGVDQVIAKPVAGPALAAALFPGSVHREALVPEAA